MQTRTNHDLGLAAERKPETSFPKTEQFHAVQTAKARALPLERETVTLNFSDTPFLLGDDKKLSPSQSRRHIHADGLNGRRQASRLPALVMASLPKHGTRRARAEKTYDGESLT